MSNPIQEKISTVHQLIEESEAEEGKSAALALRIDELTRESASLIESAKQKYATAMSELKSLARPKAPAEATATATTPKRGGRPKTVTAAAPTPAPVAAATASAPAAAKAPKQKGAKAKEPKAAKEVKGSKEPKVKAQKVAKAAKGEAAAVVAEDPSRPPLHERLRIVIGQDSVNIAQAIEKLRAHDETWVPESTDLKAYISLALSTHVKDIFERVSRGIYRVRKGGAVVAAASPGRAAGLRGPKKTVPTAKTNGSQSPANGMVDDLGNNVMESPFAGATAA